MKSQPSANGVNDRGAAKAVPVDARPANRAHRAIILLAHMLRGPSCDCHRLPKYLFRMSVSSPAAISPSIPFRGDVARATPDLDILGRLLNIPLFAIWFQHEVFWRMEASGSGQPRESAWTGTVMVRSAETWMPNGKECPSRHTVIFGYCDGQSDPTFIFEPSSSRLSRKWDGSTAGLSWAINCAAR